MSALNPIKSNIYLVPGANRSRFPFCSGLYLRGKDLRVLIDAGMGPENMTACYKEGIDVVILSHCHLDHRLTLAHFPPLPLWCHQTEAVFLQSRDRFLIGVGLDRGGIDMEKLYPGIVIQEFSIQKKLEEGDSIPLGGFSLQVLHTPGHTPGHLAFWIPEAALLFSADITLTPFGPFYGHVFSSIEDYIHSIKKLKALPAKMVVTGHSGPFQTHLADRFRAYEEVIYKRDRAVLRHLEKPRSLSCFLGKNLIYPTYLEPVSLIKWFEQVHLEKHLDRLEKKGEVVFENGFYRKI
jgi:glyoxylase-like metal-dependent hydrolase (beta-lactamase superfamily II)